MPACAQQVPEVRAAWGFDRSDLVPHPGVRFGVLPNGMRYAIMANRAPAGSLSMRLHLDAGSTAEADGEQGLMHFLEHLAFEGTQQLPYRRLLSRLSAAGLERWGDFSAATEPNDTVFRLGLARSDARAIGTGIEVMEQVARGLSFSPELVDRARIRVEVELERRTVAERIADAQTSFLVPGTAIAERPAHGSLADLRRATPGALRRLYRRVYVPQRATLVLVGDVDASAAEAMIRARFGRWRRRPASEPPSRTAVNRDRSSEVRLFIERDAPTAVTIASVASLEREADAAAPRDQAYLAHLGCRMLAHRFERLAVAAGSSIRSGDCATYVHFETARVARIDVDARDREWRGALRVAREALQSALDQGFTASELEAEVARLTPSVPAQAGRRSAALADAIVEAVRSGGIFTEPQDRAQFVAYLRRIRVDQVNAAFRAAWAAAPGRLLFISHNEAIADPPAPLD